MKTLVLLIMGAIFLVSCENKDDESDKALEGKWTLTNAICFCGFGDNPDFSGHKLTFEGNDLKIENSGEFKFLTKSEGAFTLSGNVITLKNGRQYSYVVKGPELELTFVDEPGIADDELLLEYKRS